MDYQIMDRPLGNLILFKIQNVIFSLECTLISQKTSRPCYWCGNSQGFFFSNERRFLTQARETIRNQDGECECYLTTDSPKGRMAIEQINFILVQPACENCFCGSIIKLF